MKNALTSWDEQLTHVLWRAQNAVHRRVQDSLDELGVTATQLGLAVHLEELGALSAADLSRRFHIAPQSIGTALGRLEKLGWVHRRTHPVHGRVVLYELTETGQVATARGRQTMATTNAEVSTGLTDVEAATLRELLQKVTESIDGPDATVTTAWPA